ncbi:Sigma-X negative effector [Planococcus massiliensis]|uniref:Sigma-X negative effector n=1 Tax=Planococcus massiliensis TaxID=1499687 RepID=A0A098ELA4_9BACL|nr:hypothetical protein [Planococcus massiliensis]CEG22575.1 Sigma-X negative effector [Planococcus massiliensis]
MPNKQWDDDQIESMLREFPKIKDERPKEEVYMRLNEKKPVKTKTKRWLPLLVAALAFITVGVLIASIISQNGMDSASDSSGSESSKDEAATSDTSRLNDQASPEAESSNDANSIESFGTEESAASAGIQAVYEEDLAGNTLFTMGLTENAFVIPVSFLIPDAQIARDFSQENPTSVDLYNRYAGQLNEQAFGFEEYHPMLGRISANGSIAEHMLPEDHQYDLASASIEVYTRILKETFKDMDEIVVADEQGNRAEFSQVGILEPVKPAPEKHAFYSYTTAGGDTYSVPDYGMDYESAPEALFAMKNSPNDFLENPILQELEFEVLEKEESVAVTFSEPLDLNGFDEQAVRQMIENVSLTAKSFGKPVVFSGMEQTEWQEFNLQEPLPVPVAPNQLQWPLN